MNELCPADFAGFVNEIHGSADAETTWSPFPWQQSLVEQVLRTERWPQALDVPTGLGKTAIIDAAVFVAALRPEVGRRRLFFVVDRRVIVDQTYEHAQAIAAALDRATPDSVVGRVAARLRQTGDDGPALQVGRMRGGVTWSWRWLDRPDRHAVVVGTIDQIGSRMLFRGYGVGEHLRSIDAALVGTDSLIVIDEAHLAEPLLHTATAAHAMDNGSVDRRPLLVTMSATPGSHDGEVHRIGPADEQHPVAARRLAAAKRAHLVEVTTSRRAAAEAVPAALAEWAQRLATEGAQTVGVIANTVARARAVFERLRTQLDDDAVALLTGRIRPVDRERLHHDWYPRISANRERQSDRPLVVVSTQTLECGADVDLDGLVTESASLSALTQRLGRLNRRGDLDTAHAIVVHESTVTDDDPIYGSARLRTWEWLIGQEKIVEHQAGHAQTLSALGNGVNAAPAAMADRLAALTPDQRDQMREPRPYIPVLFKSTVDAWVRTSPVPHPDTPVAPFLHGMERGRADVAVVWRHELDTAEPSAWPELIDRVSPTSDEAVEVPLRAVRRWLTNQPGAADITDLASDPSPAEADSEPVASLKVLRYPAVQEAETITADALRPGDLIVVPTGYGGYDDFGWNPDSTRAVTDLADLAHRSNRPIVRVGTHLLRLADRETPGLRKAIEALIALASTDTPDDTVTDRKYRTTLREALCVLPEAGRDDHWPLMRALLAAAGSAQVTRTRDTAEPRPPYPLTLITTSAAVADDNADLGTSMGARTELLAHQNAVRARAEQFATNLGFDTQTIRAVGLAAYWHDEGKRDSRFQAMLHGGDQLLADLAPHPLAKSGLDPTNRRAFRLAQQRSGYPNGLRHEALSARIAARHLAADTDQHNVDNDLVIHLIAAHHGRSRPLLPSVVDPDAGTVTIVVNGHSIAIDADHSVDWVAPARFTALNNRYGRWGLALLETIVRLADIWCSIRAEEA